MRAARRGLALLAFLALLISHTSCLSPLVVPADAPASVKYYAALTDYNTVKLIAVRFVQSPSTTSSEARKVLEVVEEVDMRIKQVEAARTRGLMSTNRYDAAAAMLRHVALELRAITAVQEE